MTLATRCPACGTVFRVVQDQLRVSDGWVRCGRCAEVFNATEHFVDAATAGLGVAADSAPGSLRSVADGPAADTPRAGAGVARGPAAQGADDDLVPAIDIDVAPSPPHGDGVAADGVAALDARQLAPAPSPEAAPADDLVHDPVHDLAADPSDRFSTVPAPARAPAGAPRASALPAIDTPARPSANAAASEAATALPMPPPPLPSFLRQADRAARWRQPRVRAALAAGCAGAALLLAAQAAHTWRDLLAARWPALQPPLAQACAVLGCTLQPLRRIDAWVVDSSALLRVDAAPGAGLYRLSLSLHHRAPHAVALPALDLTLTDTQGRVLVRRVLQPAELGDAPAALPAGTPWTTQATLQADGMAIAGYTIELFYP
jgi:predicted Zn finger-like uncharacterized protein